MENIIETFESGWGQLGTDESTIILTQVGDICKKDTNNLWIGLDCMQLYNIRNNIGGTYYVTKFGETDGEYVDILDIPSKKNGVTISERLANLLSLKEKNLIIIYRQLDNIGKIRIKEKKYDFNDKWTDTPIIGGIEWGIKEEKIASMIVDIDPSEDYEIGLSAMHLDNLFGNTHSKDYAIIIYKDKKFKTKVYNASHTNSNPSCGIRISSELANDLRVIPGDLVFLGLDEELNNNNSANVMKTTKSCDFVDEWSDTPLIEDMNTWCYTRGFDPFKF